MRCAISSSSRTLKAVSYTHLDVYKRQEYACIKELMDAVDEWIPTPDRKEDMPFLMPVEDVFTISGRGTVATGRVAVSYTHLVQQSVGAVEYL